MPLRHLSPGVRMIKPTSPSSPISRTNRRQVTTAGCRKRARLIRCQTAIVCRPISTKGRRTTPIPVTRKWSGIASITRLTTPSPSVRTCVLLRTKPRRTASMATGFAPMPRTVATPCVTRCHLRTKAITWRVSTWLTMRSCKTLPSIPNCRANSLPARLTISC